MFDALRLVHCCQLVNLEEFVEFNKDNILVDQETKGTLSHRNSLHIRPSTHPRNYDPSPAMADRVHRSSTNKLEKINYFRTYMVQNEKIRQRR